MPLPSLKIKSMETVENIAPKPNIEAKGRADLSPVIKILIMQPKYIDSG